ncbi:MAG: YihA family ribosome biogenesis GTP-binding protein [Undibacterium sp.]|nr:YihA family ribosome biogenesis GTP-binding protein [Opitutaceae bacterium]
MKIKSAVFEVSSPDLKSCPNWNRPEFAFIGRSNVGKSSLINLLSERRDLAMVSDKPGKTKLINFFIMNGSWCLVDLPGYGYASASKKDRFGFNEAVADYLEHRETLRCVFVLIDSRLPPQEIDVEFLRWLGTCRVRFVLIFTKADKQSATQTEANVAVFLAKLTEWRAEPPVYFISSSKTKAGRTDVLKHVEQALAKPAGG